MKYIDPFDGAKPHPDGEESATQGQPWASASLWFDKLTIPSEIEGQAGESKGWLLLLQTNVLGKK